MDVEWAVQQLEKYLDLLERVPLPPDEVKPNKKTRRRGTEEEIRQSEFTIRTIAEVLFDGERPRWVNAEWAHRMLWELTDGDSVRAKLGVGEPPPSFTGKQLHPWVWDAAEPHWMSGNHDAAVWAAAVNVNSRLQQKVGRRDLGESKLLEQAFSTSPAEEGKPRLRLCDDSNPELFKDMHVGAAQFGKGLFSAIRNTLNHVDASQHNIREAEALEALASFSLLSRWIDNAELVLHT